MGRELRVRGDTCQVVSVISSAYGDFDERPYKPNGKPIFVNPETQMLEEVDFSKPDGIRWTGDCYVILPQTTPVRSNGNDVLFHPSLGEFAEVRPGWNRRGLDKVRDYRPVIAP